MTFCGFDKDCVAYDAHIQCPGYSGPQPVCPGCHDRGQRDLNLLRYDYVDLSQLIPQADARNDARIFRPRPESKPPINIHVWQLRADIAYQVMLTARHLREALGSARYHPEPSREGWRLDHDLRYLGDHVLDLAAQPAVEHYWTTDVLEVTSRDGLGMLAALQALHRRARRVCGTDPRTITVPGECSKCSTPSLRRHDDDPGIIWCVHCRHKISGDEYTKMVRMQLPGT